MQCRGRVLRPIFSGSIIIEGSHCKGAHGDGHYTDLLVLSLHTREPDISLDLLHSRPKVKKYQDIKKISGGQKNIRRARKNIRVPLLNCKL